MKRKKKETQPRQQRRSSGNTNNATFATRQIMYSLLMTALLFGLASILSPSDMASQREKQQLQEKMIDRLHAMQMQVHLRGGRLEEDDATMLLRLTGKNIDHAPKKDEKQEVAKKDPGYYVPISCSQILQDQLEKEEVMEIVDPNNHILHARQVVRDRGPNFWVSLHKQEYDSARWVIMERGDYYEMALSSAFSEILQDPSTMAEQRVVDVGGNIGFFSLLSASNGPNIVVDSFEPNDKNLLRFCESLHLNNWESEYDTKGSIHSRSQVNVYPYGVGQKAGTFYFLEHETNPGQGKIIENKRRLRKTDLNRTSEMKVLKLDEFAKARGWFENRPEIAILKVDVEGQDHLVIKGAAELIQAKMVRNIFMEISMPGKKAAKEVEETRRALQIIQQAGYDLHKYGDWIGPDKDANDAFPHQDDGFVDALIEKTRNTRNGQLNLWWTLRPERQQKRKPSQ